MSGQPDQVKGHIKEATGIVTGDKDLEAEGKSDRKIGEAEAHVEQAKDKIGGVLEATKDKVDEVATKVADTLQK